MAPQVPSKGFGLQNPWMGPQVPSKGFPKMLIFFFWHLRSHPRATAPSLGQCWQPSLCPFLWYCSFLCKHFYSIPASFGPAWTPKPLDGTSGSIQGQTPRVWVNVIACISMVNHIYLVYMLLVFQPHLVQLGLQNPWMAPQVPSKGKRLESGSMLAALFACISMVNHISLVYMLLVFQLRLVQLGLQNPWSQDSILRP